MFTGLVLGRHWCSDEWPECVEVMHEGAGDSIKYVPERTGHMTQVKGGPVCSVWKFDCCGFEFVENDCAAYQTELPGTWCPNCGAKVV